jgi:hypothetical protein
MAAEGYSSNDGDFLVRLNKCVSSGTKTTTMKSRKIKQILKGNLLKVVYTGLNQMQLAYRQVWFMWRFKRLFWYYNTFTA